MSAHTPVLLHEAINSVLIDANGLYVDGTFGRGGHTKELLSRLSGKGRVIGFDKDPIAIDLGKVVFKFEERLELIHESFSKLHLVLKKRGDLGDVGNHQLGGILEEGRVAVDNFGWLIVSLLAAMTGGAVE